MKKEKTLSLPKGMREVHCEGDIWYWKYTRSGILLIDPLRTKKRFVSWDEFFISHFDVDREQWKRNFHIKPHEVKEYIEREYYGAS